MSLEGGEGGRGGGERGGERGGMRRREGDERERNLKYAHAHSSSIP